LLNDAEVGTPPQIRAGRGAGPILARGDRLFI
jgi:hypothetical protein